MGETISSLVFRPPTPTFIKADRFFYIEIPQVEHDFTQMCSTGCVAATPGVVSHNKASIASINSGPHRIPAFFIKRRGARITILFSHGNAEDLGMMCVSPLSNHDVHLYNGLTMIFAFICIPLKVF